MFLCQLRRNSRLIVNILNIRRSSKHVSEVPHKAETKHAAADLQEINRFEAVLGCGSNMWPSCSQSRHYAIQHRDTRLVIPAYAMIVTLS